MQIEDIQQFLRYYAKVKNRTRRLFPYIPPDQIEWTYRAGKFTIGDLIRHLACIERYMYGETVLLRPSQYQGCGSHYAEGYEATLAFYEAMYEESTAIFSQLGPAELMRKCQTPAGTPITTWKWLRALVEHEVHHRGQLYVYLGILGISTPPIYGLTSEEVIERSQRHP
ncbi:MAG: DinB family protein [Bacteroidota bacterium]